eukprot:7215798-Karenia_brevis.AAC.1
MCAARTRRRWGPRLVGLDSAALKMLHLLLHSHLRSWLNPRATSGQVLQGYGRDTAALQIDAG